MPRVFCLFGAGSPRQWGVHLARFARVTEIGKSAGHQLVSPADLPNKIS